jgi:HD-GYP domain-containing protein (c-di-GMP phosphodiesterase class II)
MRRNVEEAAATKLADLRSKSETILEALYNQITAKSPKVKSFEGAVYAFKTISEFSLALDEKNSEQLHPLLVVQAMLEVFQEIPEVRRAIKGNWERIYREIQDRLKMEQAPRERGAIAYDPDK